MEPGICPRYKAILFFQRLQGVAMNKHVRMGLVVVLGVSLAGCANTKPKQVLCTVLGATAGTAIGVAAAGEAENGALAGGAIIGGVAGYFLCREGEQPAPTPAPAPAPAPAPVAKPAPPPPPPAPAVGSKIISLEGTNFEFDKAVITPAGQQKLDAAAATMAANPTVEVSVEGHTDAVGSDVYNQGLSERRANAAVAYLVAKGVDASRMRAVGYGESKPAASNDTAEGRASNRRVDLVVTKN